MNKKLVMVGVSIAVGGVMLFTTAFASVASTSGYEAFKTAVKTTAKAKNVTSNIVVTLKDNDAILADVNSTVKADNTKHAVSSLTTIQADGQTKRMQVYNQEDKVVLKDSTGDVYSVIENSKEKTYKHSKEYNNVHETEAIRAGEMVIDALVGNLKNYVTLDEKTNGQKEVELQLSGNQIPTVVNTLASLAIKEAGKEHENDYSEAYENKLPTEFDIEVEPPKLVDDIRIENVNFKSEINKDNLIEGQTADITISGKDAGGIVHHVVLSINMSLSNFNNTVPDTVDLKGKQVKVFESKDFEYHQ